MHNEPSLTRQERKNLEEIEKEMGKQSLQILEKAGITIKYNFTPLISLLPKEKDFHEYLKKQLEIKNSYNLYKFNTQVEKEFLFTKFKTYNTENLATFESNCKKYNLIQEEIAKILKFRFENKLDITGSSKKSYRKIKK